MCIYEEAFAKTDKTDAILVIGEKKMHVNKALLAYHSQYFQTLFNSDFKEKSMEEIPIDDVIFEDFATLLSLFNENPLPITKSNAENLIKLSDRFLLSNPKIQVERFIIETSTFTRHEKLILADKYNLEKLLEHTLQLYYNEKKAFEDFYYDRDRNFSDELKVKMFDKFFDKQEIRSKLLEMEIYENAFAETDKTDAILVAQGHKMHVNKALLSYHSDYFNTLFNSDFKEKSMEEIPIDDVIFEDFATLLSLVQDKPIVPKKEEAEKLLELSDRFLMPCAKRHVELFICSTKIDRLEKLKIADRFDLDILRDNSLAEYKNWCDYKTIYEDGKNFSQKTKALIFDDFFYGFQDRKQ